MKNRLSIYKITPLLPTKIQINWPFGSGEEAKKAAILDFRSELFLAIFDLRHHNASYQVSIQLAEGRRRSRLLKQLLTPLDERRTLVLV